MFTLQIKYLRAIQLYSNGGNFWVLAASAEAQGSRAVTHFHTNLLIIQLNKVNLEPACSAVLY